MKPFHELLREYRLAAGYGVRQAAREAGISPTYVSHMETDPNKSPPREEVLARLESMYDAPRDLFVLAAGRVPVRVQEQIFSDPDIVVLLDTLRIRGIKAKDIHNFITLITLINKENP